MGATLHVLLDLFDACVLRRAARSVDAARVAMRSAAL